MTLHIRPISILLTLLLALPLAAQSEQSDRITKLESALDELVRQAEAIRKELDEIKGTTSGDLMAVEPLTPLTDVQTVETQTAAPGASKALNPDISVIGTMLGHAGSTNPFETTSTFETEGKGRSPLAFEETEIAFEAFIDPYARGRFFIAIGDEGAELEEGYAQFVTLPKGFTAKAGKLKAQFGKANTWHTHRRPWVDQPLMVQRFFGGEGLADTGVSVSRSFGNPWGAFVEATGEVFSGNAEGVFERQASNDLFYNTHLKFFRDLDENSNLEIGTSWAQGTLATPEGAGGSNRFTGLDVTYRWKPLARSYNSFIGRVEALANDRSDSDRTLFGFYAAADYQLARRWFAGVRLDHADRGFVLGDALILPNARFSDRAVSATITFWPSEFSQLRAQLRRTSYGDLETVNELLLQLQFAIGAHGAHIF